MLVGTSPEDSGGSSGGDVGTADRSSGSRWPRHETVTLIQIRTDMDAEFRDAAVKTPLWDKVSKKLAELGYSRSAKKCREKFENVFKYYKRTKDCRNPKSEGKSYHYFDQLEVLDSQPPPQSDLATTQATPLSIAMPAQNLPQTVTCNPIPSQQNPLSISFSLPQTVTCNHPIPSQQNPLSISLSAPPPTTNQNVPSVSFSTSTSSDEEEPERQGKRKRKRKWADFFDRLTSEVMGRQEEMQRKFLEALEKREQEHVAREEAWRAQEVARMSREREILAQERAVAAAKDAAVFAFLQKVSANDKQIPSDQPRPPPPPPPTAEPLASVPTPVSAFAPSPSDLQMISSLQSMRKPKLDDRGEIVNLGQNPSPSRWPKSEIEALIKLRTNLDLKYHDNLPKGPLWEEISAGMLRLGYNRNPKRCKEKWENINKYYKKMKESNKKRPEDSKTCPYFDQLEAIYRERAKTEQVKQENVAVPIMVQPERQWPAMEGHHSDDDVDNEDGAANYDRSTVGTTQ